MREEISASQRPSCFLLFFLFIPLTTPILQQSLMTFAGPLDVAKNNDVAFMAPLYLSRSSACKFSPHLNWVSYFLVIKFKTRWVFYRHIPRPSFNPHPGSRVIVCDSIFLPRNALARSLSLLVDDNPVAVSSEIVQCQPQIHGSNNHQCAPINLADETCEALVIDFQAPS